ncbi:carbohydrate ABC transporter membrane protein 2 (CUT1 family) [Hydrogenispora ethanolica]|uniref:Carbohydrate ABC transporter membrane protein 2 (CUT1 family) n=1 Tax=Hydrogenispora ethanolica TaxID=1082276 RepID=A0A4R1R8X1_HYDET|nr:ABC transporter permease subunit [Hydrogenispora ethanolica]TCL62058.1 carbohydrate ABC transporter membrane protein 2 (CUT1 family) [Hydrogenispora ethanolica]
MRSEKFNKNDSLGKIIFIYAVLVTMAFISLYPLLDIVKIALRPASSLFSTDLSLIPRNATFKNFHTALWVRPYFTWLKNSLIVALSSTVLSIAIAVAAGYAFSRFRFRGRNLGLLAFLLTQIFPAPMMLLPTYILLKNFGLLNHYGGGIVPYIALTVPFSVWVLKGYFDTIPRSFEESAYLDGANFAQVLWGIMLPLSIPALGVVLLNTFMATWNEFVTANIVFTDTELHTLPVGIFNMTGSLGADWGIFSAACLVTALPVIVLYIAMSKFFISGLTLGGVRE